MPSCVSSTETVEIELNSRFSPLMVRFIFRVVTPNGFSCEEFALVLRKTDSSQLKLFGMTANFNLCRRCKRKSRWVMPFATGTFWWQCDLRNLPVREWMNRGAKTLRAKRPARPHRHGRLSLACRKAPHWSEPGAP